MLNSRLEKFMEVVMRVLIAVVAVLLVMLIGVEMGRHDSIELKDVEAEAVVNAELPEEKEEVVETVLPAVVEIVEEEKEVAEVEKVKVKKKKKKITTEKVDEYPNIEDTFIDQKYVEMCEVIGRIYNVSPEIMEAMIEKESRGNASAVNSSGCKGLCQVSERWHKKRMNKLGVTDLLDPYSNILVATDYLAELCEDTGDMYTALAYYGGWVNSNGTLKRNADSYISSLMKRAEDLEKKHGKEFGKTVDK